MSATIKAIHTLLVTLSAVELCEVIQRSAELCAELSQKQSIASASAQVSAPAPAPASSPAPAPAPVPSPVLASAASARMKRPTSVFNQESEMNRIDIPTRFANLLGWAHVEADPSATMASEDDAESESDESNMDHSKKRRTMKKCFTDGQRIRHTIRDKIWIGAYDSSKNVIVHNGTTYRTLSMFATAHVLTEHNPHRATPRDGWKNCECEVKGEWVSTYELPC